ncbi:uncharacterized protein LOC143032789 [Oratosquilla oratoria]|uniref:uncharacterized protein LOC143032789 n=1 Tax=Oratosquilla oratoria TaxID=337810 RepID=UPI003F759B59
METSRNLFSSQTVKPLEGSPAIPWLLTGCVQAMGKEEMTRKFQNYENHVLQRDGTVFQGNEFEGKVAICELDRRGLICDLAIKDNCSDNEETYFDHDDEFVGGSNHSDSDATYCSIVVPEETIMKSQEEMGLSEVEEEGSSNTWKSPSLLCNFANKFNGEDEDLENFKQFDRSETRVTSCDGMSNDVHITKAQDDTSALPDCVKNSNGLQSKERSHMGLKEGSFDLDGSSCAIVQTNSETERDQGSASMLPLPSFSVISGRGDLHWQNSELDCMTMTTSECSELLPQLMNTNPFGDKSSGCELLHLSPDPFSDLLSKLPHIELGEGWNVDKSVVDSVCDTSDRSRISPRKKENILHSDLSKPSSNSLVVGFETPLLEPETNDFGFTPCQMEETNTTPDGNHSTVLYPSEVYSQAIEGQNIIPHNAGMLSSNAQHQQPTSVVCNQLSTSQVSPKFTAQTPSKILEEVPSKSTFFLPLSGSTPSPLQLEVSFDLATQVNSPIISQDAISKAIEMISTPGCQNGISYLLKDINLLGDDGKEKCGDALGSVEALSRPQDHMDKQVEKGVTLPVLQSKVPNNQNSNEFVSVDVNSATSEFTSASTRGNFFHPEKWDADKENIQSENVDYSNLDSNDIRHGANISTSHHIGQSVIGHIDNVSSKSLWTDIPGLLQEGNSQGLPKVIHSSNILQGQDMTSAVGPVSGCSPRKKRQNRDRQTHGYVKSHKKYGLPPMTTFGSAVARMVQRLQKISTDIYRQVLKRRDLKAIQEELRTASSVIYRLHNGMVSMNKGKDFHASIMADGTLESSDGLFFTTPQAWLQALTKSYKKKEQAFKKIQYKGTTLYEIAARHARGDGPRRNEVGGVVGGGGGGGGDGGLAGERNSREIEEKRKFGFRCVGRVSEEEMLILRRKSQGKSLQTSGDDGGVHPTSPGLSGGHDPVTGVTCFPKEFLGFCGSATRTRVDQNSPFGLGATEGGLYPHHPGCECDKGLGCGASGGVTGSGTMGRSLGFALGQNSASRSLEEREVSSRDVNLQTHSSFSPRLGFSRRSGLKVVAEPSSGNGSKNPGPPSGPPEEKSQGHHHTGLPEARSRSHGSSGLPEGSFETLREDQERRRGQQPADQSSSYPVPSSRHPVRGSPRHDVRSEASTVSSVAFWRQSLRAIKRLLFVIEVANRKANF